MGLAVSSHVDYPEIRPSGSLRKNGKLHTYPPEVKRTVAIPSIRGVSEKFKHIANRYNLKLFSK
jgi:hypothetical protein